jgi:hypothetical protein
VGFYKANGAAKITVAPSANLVATQAIDMLASLTLDKTYLPTGDIFNPFTLKLGEVNIDIRGALAAGGSIRADALYSSTVSATNGLLKVVIPFGVAAITGDTQITVVGGARLNAGAGVLLRAASDTSAEAEATMGALKFTLALAVVQAETHVKVGDTAAIAAGGAVKLSAMNAVRAEAAALGKKPSMLALKPASGGYIAGSFVFQDTSATIADHASVSSGAALSVRSESRLNTATTTVSIPASQSDGSGGESFLPTDQIRLMSIVPFVETKLLKVEKAPNQTAFGKLLSGVTGSNSLGNKFTDATKTASSSGTPSSTKQVVGALALAYAGNTNSALIDTTGSVTAAGALDVTALAATVNQVRADGSLYKTPMAQAEDAKNSGGAGVAIAVTNHDNSARIIAGSIAARGLSVSAVTGRIVSSSIAKAGHIPKTSSFGLGGAVSVHVVIGRNEALVGSGAAYNLTGAR